MPTWAQNINAAGATFPYPIYSKWFDEYHKLRPNVQINYQSIGSGGGIRQLLDRTVDFGASDAAMKPEEITAAYDLLSDPKKREKYDRFGRDWEAYARAGASAGGAGAAGGPRAGDPFGPGGPFAGYTGFSTGGGPGGVRYEFRTSGGDAGAY